MSGSLYPLLAVATPGWPAIALLVSLGAWLACDETAFAQTWFAQPLPASILAGLIVGDASLGLVVGLPFQLAALGNLPVGQSFLGDRTTPIIGVVWALARTGFCQQDHLVLAGMGAGAAQVGWLLVFLALASGVGHAILRFERRLHLRWSAVGIRTLRDGRLDRLDRLQLLCVATTLVRGGISVAVWGWFVTALWIPGFSRLPERVIAMLAYLPAFTPVLAVGALVDVYGSRQGLRWFGGSFSLSLLMIAVVMWLGWVS